MERIIAFLIMLGGICLFIWFIVALIRMFGRVGKPNQSMNEMNERLRHIEEDIRQIRNQIGN